MDGECDIMGGPVGGGGWGQMMEGEDSAFSAVMAWRERAPRREVSIMLEISSLCDGWLKCPLSFYFGFLFS